MEFEHPGNLAVDVTELSWRKADRPHLTHRADFTPAVAAAIGPVSAQQASAAYRARYDEDGFLHAAARDGVRPFADRAAQIHTMAERLLRDQTAVRSPLHPSSVRQRQAGARETGLGSG
ncbi:hypothetical protein ACFWZK_20245 [[Kitasatospora] papulosa]|uniref:hypothetical protein n=1 Tax=[Kitasatospora] papulosa TaxID=1464011 RepID=UPI0036843FA9